MRTRIFNKMTAKEVEAYLARGGETIFVAVGVIEVHGGMPIDAEQIIPEAYALAMAEEADGLAMINLPYFFPGGTIVSNSTVQVSIREGIDYLMMLGRSLAAQGFRKIFMVSGHGPARLYVDPFCRDFFQKTKIHVCHLNLMAVMHNFAPKDDGLEGLDSLGVGAYKMLGQLDYIPIDGNEERMTPADPLSPEAKALGEVLAPLGSGVSLLFGTPEQHVPEIHFKSREDLEETAKKGEELIRATAANIDWDNIKKVLDGYEDYVGRLLEKYPRLKGQY